MTRDTFDMFDCQNERGRFGEDAPKEKRADALTLVLHHTTERAALLSENGEESAAKWIALSHIEIEQTGGIAHGHTRTGKRGKWPVVTVAMPEWLAKKEGFL